jgi:hypothetical protein
VTFFPKSVTTSVWRNSAQKDGLDSKLRHDLVGFACPTTFTEHLQRPIPPPARVDVLGAQIVFRQPLETGGPILQKFKQKQFRPRGLLRRSLCIRNRNPCV